MANLLKSTWSELDPAEIRFLLLERIGRPGQYHNRAKNPHKFYLPLAGSTCRLELTFSDKKELIAIEPGPAFDAAQWDQIVQEVESTGPIKVGRDCSFSSYRVTGAWRGSRSGLQILPPPKEAPVSPIEIAEHPFVLEFPVKVSDRWPITNYRRLKEHRCFTLLLNILLAGQTCTQPRRHRHLWAIEPGESRAKWVQEFYFVDYGQPISDTPSVLSAELLKEVTSSTYLEIMGHDGRGLQIPNDLDDMICCYQRLSRKHRDAFDRGSYWMDMSSRQWTLSYSASFASLVIAIEALGDRKDPKKGATARFHEHMEKYAPGVSLQDRRKQMYALRSDVLHGSGLVKLDQDADMSWSPPEEEDRALMDELWNLTKISMRNWLKNPPA